MSLQAVAWWLFLTREMLSFRAATQHRTRPSGRLGRCACHARLGWRCPWLPLPNILDEDACGMQEVAEARPKSWRPVDFLDVEGLRCHHLKSRQAPADLGADLNPTGASEAPTGLPRTWQAKAGSCLEARL